MVRCSVLGCKSDSEKKIDGLSFHSFPDEPKLRKLWIAATNRINWIPKRSSKICSEHFKREILWKVGKKTFLKPNSVPTKFTGSESEKADGPSCEMEVDNSQLSCLENLGTGSWFLQYKSRLLNRIRRSEIQQDTDEDTESTPPLTALEAQFAAVCGADTVTGGSHIHQEVSSDPLWHNGSASSVSNEQSSYDEQESYRHSDSEREDSPIITSHKGALTNKPNRPIISNNRLEVFGRILGLKLQEVQENQRAIAEKIIKDALFMAEQGILTMDHAFNFANAHNNNSN